MKRDKFGAEDSASDGWSRTVIVPRSADRRVLADGTRVGEVEIAGVIGEGSSGIVYLAIDPSLERRVAVKEYLPSALASRSRDGQVVVHSEDLMPAFRAGLDGFVAEARLLARFDHPSLVKVYRVWEANGTAYLVMPYYEGPTLARMLAELGHPPDEAALRGLVLPLLDALEVIHAGGQLHRDISADNILLTATGPVLLDFGVARRAIGGLTHVPTVVLKRGFAPIEQYGESESLRSGPWTDLYALGSVLHLAITGEPPTIAVERLWDDWLEPLARAAEGRYSPGLLAAVDAMLAVKPSQRPQDVAALRLLLAVDAGAAPAPVEAPPVLDALMSMPFAGTGRWASDAATQGAPASPVTAMEWSPVASTAAAPAANGRRGAVMMAMLSAVLAVGLGFGVRALTVSVDRGAAPRLAPAAPVAAARPALAATPSAQALSQDDPVKSPGPAAAPVPLAIARTASKPVRTAATVSNSAGVGSIAVASAEPIVPTALASARWPSRCFDILQKASLERVSDEETAFLRETCH